MSASSRHPRWRPGGVEIGRRHAAPRIRDFRYEQRVFPSEWRLHACSGRNERDLCAYDYTLPAPTRPAE